MRSDDELLSHIREQTGIRRQRRQRAAVGAAAAAVVLLLGIGALAGTGGGDSEGLTADGPGSTSTTSEAPTTSTSPSTTSSTTTSTTTSTTSTTAPVETTTSTTEVATPTTTTLPPIAPVTGTSAGGGLTLTATAVQDRARPGWVQVTVRIVDDHGSGPGGVVQWVYAESEVEPYGGGQSDWLADCPAAGDDLRPDPAAGPIDETYTLTHQYEAGRTFVELEVRAESSFCTSDAAGVAVMLEVPIGG